ncbi:MAG: ABC transporter permease [Gemmatimonadales bacterium]|nr:ABC transporter permease [Gemmatimonadales bacterium]
MSAILFDSVRVAHRVLIELMRNRRLLFFWILFPTLMLLLFGWVYADEYGGLGPSFTWTAPGILLGAAMFFSCLGGPVSLIVGERERRTLRRLLLSPLSGTAYYGGVVLAHLAIALGQAAIVYGLTYAAGGGFRGSVWLGALILFLSAMCYVGLGFFFGARFAGRTEDVTGPVAAVGVPLLVMGGTFFPVELLPPFLHTLAQADPIYHMNMALKAVAQEGADIKAIALNLFFLLGFAACSLALGTRAYRQMLGRERAGA